VRGREPQEKEPVLGLGFWVWGFGFWVLGLGLGVWGLGFGVWEVGFRVQELRGWGRLVRGLQRCARDSPQKWKPRLSCLGAHLVVDNDVHGPPRGVALDVRQAQRLVYHPLPSPPFLHAESESEQEGERDMGSEREREKEIKRHM